MRADGLNESGTTDGSWGFAPSRQQPDWPEHIDVPANDFAVLAATAARLRQSSSGSHLGLAPFTHDGFPTAASDVAGEHARFKQS